MTSAVGRERARERRLAADYSTRRLAKYLGAFCGEIDRALEFGLIPEPERPGGCWSAATAGEIRGRWPVTTAQVECIGVPGLRRRGWSGVMIADLLGAPDTTADGRPVWRLQRVEEAEARPEFAARRLRPEGRG